MGRHSPPPSHPSEPSDTSQVLSFFPPSLPSALLPRCCVTLQSAAAAAAAVAPAAVAVSVAAAEGKWGRGEIWREGRDFPFPATSFFFFFLFFPLPRPLFCRIEQKLTCNNDWEERDRGGGRNELK